MTTTKAVKMTTMWTVTGSPVGDLRVVARDGMIAAIEFSPFKGSPSGEPIGEQADGNPLLRSAVDQLAAYFARDLKEFDLPLAPRGSAFQQRVWEQLRAIGYGETASYGEIARRLGMTKPRRGQSAWLTGATPSRS